MSIDKIKLDLLPREYGVELDINHTKRLLRLMIIIRNGYMYLFEVLWIAAHLHDLGAYPAWVQKDINLALRLVRWQIIIC